ncbi:unnamed protein product [Dicrocoelium dendriticum]|nr:unnamed protein product [Dicrocoelium dendriticum]
MDWQIIRTQIHDRLCGPDPYPTILCDLEKVLNQVVRQDKSDRDVATTEDFRRHFSKLIAFSELDSSLRQLLIELICILDVGTVSKCLTDLFLRPTSEIFGTVHWDNILALISTLTVAIKGGVSAIRGLIRLILNAVFQNHPDSGSSSLDFLQIDDDHFATELKNQADAFSSRAFQLFSSAILIARQLCLEDVRITGISYSQWWSETFCTKSSDGAHSILQSQASIVLLADLLLELLPWESDPCLLSIQLLNQPSRSTLPAATKKAVTKATTSHSVSKSDSQADVLDTTDIVFGADTLAELQSFDAAYLASCCQRWNDYVEIGRGRLAELRHEESGRAAAKCDTNSVDVSGSRTCGWSEIFGWIVDIAQQLVNGDTEKSDIRLPPSLLEANLFRPRYFRETLVPAMLNAPELQELSEELRVAHSQLLHGIELQGLGHLLAPSPQTDSNVPRTKNKQESNQRKRTGNVLKKPRVSVPKRQKTTK